LDTDYTGLAPFWPLSGDRKVVDVFRAYPLAHRHFFGVPPNGTVLFQVALSVVSILSGDGWCNSRFSADWNGSFIMCPFVELQVVVPEIMPSRGKSFRSR